jgi:protein gp37
MGSNTSISWTDHTFNPWWGCTKVSAGCDHCYAETFDKRVGGAHWGKGQPRREFGDKHGAEPLAWDAAAAKAEKKELVFCASMADVMDDESPIGARDRLWELIDSTPNLIWQLLTKRPHRYNTSYLPREFKHGNVWLGTTTEDQDAYNLRWPILYRAGLSHYLKTFVSYEPAIGPLELTGAGKWAIVPDWVICGGESGHGSRPMDAAWARSLRDQCASMGAAFHMKQMGSVFGPHKGNELPDDLNIKQFPER